MHLDNRSKADLNDVKSLATQIWYEGGSEHEREELFNLFDRRRRGYTTMEEVKTVMKEKLVVPVSDQDFEDLLGIIGGDWSSSISISDFARIEREIS